MMGQQCRSESLFYYFRIEDHIPEDHLRRAIDRYVNLDFVREKLKPFYSETGRVSIDPERLFAFDDIEPFDLCVMEISRRTAPFCVMVLHGEEVATAVPRRNFESARSI